VPLGQAQIQAAGIVRRVASRRGSTLAPTTTVCSLRMMTPPLTLTTAMQIAAAYGGDEL